VKGARWVIAAMLGLAITGCDPSPPVNVAPPSGRGWSAAPIAEDTHSVIAQRLPRVTYQGGPLLLNPHIVSVTFAGDDPAIIDRLVSFSDTITHSDWWHQAVETYCTPSQDCVGEGGPADHLHVDAPLAAQVRDVDIDDLLIGLAGDRRFDTAEPDLLLIVYLPAGVQLTEATSGGYCGDGPRGYHRSVRIGNIKVAYAAVPRCGDLDATTTTASHEILEAVTNPDPSMPGFALDRGSVSGGFTAAGAEPADPCGLITERLPQTIIDGVTVHRVWSNRAAAGGHDPCQPATPGAPYRALVPDQPTVRLDHVGATTTIGLQAFSDQSVPAWATSALDLTGYQEHQHYLDIVLDAVTVTPGQKAELTITVRSIPAHQSAVVALRSTFAGHTHMWPLLVVMR